MFSFKLTKIIIIIQGGPYFWLDVNLWPKSAHILALLENDPIKRMVTSTIFKQHYLIKKILHNN